MSGSSALLITDPWRAAVDQVIEVYKANLGTDLHSVYVRGTVGTGRAILGISDIDTFAVTLNKTVSLDDEQRRLTESYTFTSKIELDVFRLDEVLTNRHAAYSRQFVVKCLSACVFGFDLGAELGGFLPNDELARHMGGLAFAANLEKGMSHLAMVPDDLVQAWCSWLCKVFLRSGFCLVLSEDKTFTRDLWPCYMHFAHHFPARAHQMHQALDWALNPTDERDRLLFFARNFGGWLSDEITRRSLHERHQVKE